MKYEYCQVNLERIYMEMESEFGPGSYRLGDVVVQTDKEEIIRGKHFLDIFNVLGSLGWRMCGNNDNIFYFMREVKE